MENIQSGKTLKSLSISFIIEKKHKNAVTLNSSRKTDLSRQIVVISVNGENWQINAEILIEVIDHGEIAVLEVDGRIGYKVQGTLTVAKTIFAEQTDNTELRLARRVILMEEIASLWGK